MANNTLYENVLKTEKYDKKYTIEEALKMASDFREYIERQLAKLEEGERALQVIYCNSDKKALEEAFKGGNTHVNLGN
jgi:hypothetical protein